MKSPEKITLSDEDFSALQRIDEAFDKRESDLGRERGMEIQKQWQIIREKYGMQNSLVHQVGATVFFLRNPTKEEQDYFLRAVMK